MNADYYPMLFKRKSFHLFHNIANESISQAELTEIENAFQHFERLMPEIRTMLRIVPSETIGTKRDAEYFLMLYSEKKDGMLINAGYLGEQLDLYLVQHDIGTLWYGLGKPDKQTVDGLEYVIMIAVRKVSDPAKYRKEMFKARRKPVEEIWKGKTLGVAEIARFAPSACNSQPWIVRNDGESLMVSRYSKRARIGLLTPKTAAYFNRIDIGIFLCVTEICMAQQKIKAERELFSDDGTAETAPVAKYHLLPAD